MKKNLKVRSIKNRNRKIKAYSSVDDIPAYRFFNIIELGDFRWLLQCKELPKFYDNSLLYGIYDKLIKQIDKINGTNDFSYNLKENQERIIENNRMVGLISAFALMKYDCKKAIKGLAYFGVNIENCSIKNIKKVRGIIMREQTRIKLEGIQNNELTKAGNSNSIKYTHAVVQASNILKRHIDYKQITLTEWLFLQKEIDLLIALKKKDGKTA